MFNGEVAKSALRGVSINCAKVRKLIPLLTRYESAIEKLLEEGTIQKWPVLVLYPEGTKGEMYNTVTKKWETLGDAGAVRSMRWEVELIDAMRGTEATWEWKQIVFGDVI
jgi:homocysteine S-methyltransferase